MPAASKTQTLINHLLGEIEAGRLRPGDKIPSANELKTIAARLVGEEKPVSITVVREAVNYLKATGVLEGLSGVGVFVRESEKP